MEGTYLTGGDLEAVQVVTPAHQAAPVVELHGDIDREVAEPLWDGVSAGSERGCDVLVDLADVSLIDRAALTMLVRAHHLADRRGCRVCLVAPSAAVRRTLAATGLNAVFPVFGDRRQALRGLPSPSPAPRR
ncbi:STAS domain-containing protein [Paractinoplanes rishiriensis]|uniref:Anti-sigma factor antagonist n=1 Tax=Paractinoplanes rishiriensis TaxID=1050105 RepID=A0A919K9D8_9ACTN|nr:STAS domain-containing protein [Actinoplanes rishiriensis]GIF01246.1 hypothetical protein Ari01nite_87100 [Actinoplanes rishiriensis]